MAWKPSCSWASLLIQDLTTLLLTLQDRQYGVERRTYIEENQIRRPQQYDMPAADSQGRSHADWRQREDPSPVFSSRHDSHTAGGPPEVKPEANAIPDGLSFAAFID